VNKKLIFILLILLLVPSANALCIPFIQDCSQDIIIIRRGSNEDVNYTWIDTMEFAFEQPAKNVDVEIIGAELIISSSSNISSGSPINISTGISKIQLTVLSGADTTGDITINAVKHDRDTGAKTEPFSETLALDGVGDMNMTVEWIGNKTASDDINLTTTNFNGALKLTQWSFYQNLQEDFNIIRVSVTIETADTASAKSFDFNFFKVGGDGDIITLVEFNDIDFAPNGIARNRIYRLDRNCVSSDCLIDGRIDGIHVAFDQSNIETVEVIITYEFTRQLQVSGVAGNNVTRLIAGSNITLSPNTGLGDVTINSTGGGGGDYGDSNVNVIIANRMPLTDANINFDLNDAFHDGSIIDMSEGEFLNIDAVRSGSETTQLMDIDVADSSSGNSNHIDFTAVSSGTGNQTLLTLNHTSSNDGDPQALYAVATSSGLGDAWAGQFEASATGGGDATGILAGAYDNAGGSDANLYGAYFYVNKERAGSIGRALFLESGGAQAVDFGIQLAGTFTTGIDFNTGTITSQFRDATGAYNLADLNTNAETKCDGNVFFSGDGECVAIGGGGSGDVTASANLADNNVVRGDGGAKGVQTSGIAIDDSDNVSGMGTLSSGAITSGDITILDATPILVFKDSDSLGAASVGFIEWRDSGGGRAGFLGNNTSGDDGFLWKNEQGGNIGIQTTGAGELQIFANIDAQDNNITTTGTGTFEDLNVVGDILGNNLTIVGGTAVGDGLTWKDSSGEIVPALAIFKDGALLLSAEGGNTRTELRFQEPVLTGENYVGFRAPSSIATNLVFDLPAADGATGEALLTAGSTNLFFSDLTGIAGYVADEHIDWTNATDNFLTTGTINGGDATIDGNVTINDSNLNINGLTYSWPSVRGTDGQVLTENGDGGLAWETAAGGGNDKVGIDSGATPGFLGAAFSDGVLRTDSSLDYVDGGDFVTLSLDSTLKSNYDAAFAHVSANGSSHTFIDQSVISGSSPTFDGTNITGVASIDVVDESADTTTFPLFANSTTGAIAPKTGTNLTFNSSSGLLGSTSYTATGTVTGEQLTSTDDITAGDNFLASNGTATAGNVPYSFTGDTDTGMFRSASNVLNFSTGGIERMEIVAGLIRFFEPVDIDDDLTVDGELAGTKHSFLLSRDASFTVIAGMGGTQFVKAGEVIMTNARGIVMPRAGSIVGISVMYDVTASSGALTLNAMVNGTNVWSNALSATVAANKVDSFTQARGTDTFSADNDLEVNFTGTDVTIDDVIITLEVYYDS